MIAVSSFAVMLPVVDHTARLVATWARAGLRWYVAAPRVDTAALEPQIGRLSPQPATGGFHGFLVTLSCYKSISIFVPNTVLPDQYRYQSSLSNSAILCR